MKARGLHAKKKSIFQAIFTPLIVIMFLQSMLFYVMAVYGGLQDTLDKNAADILQERLSNRENEIEMKFSSEWSNFLPFEMELDELYEQYGSEDSLIGDASTRNRFLNDASGILIRMLRENQVNGAFLILNDELEWSEPTGTQQKVGLCIRDLDQTSNYQDRRDLLLERCPSALIEALGCTLDSWWEARYTFDPNDSANNGAFYYQPLKAAWENPNVKNTSLAYFCGPHSLSQNDRPVITYSIPLVDQHGYPYGVLGVELTVKYLGTLLPSTELSYPDQSCYILALYDSLNNTYTPIASNGAMFNRCFSSDHVIVSEKLDGDKGFFMTGRTDTEIYVNAASIKVYDNNSPFESKQPVLLAMVESKALFAYSRSVRNLLLWTSILSLAIGVAGIFLVSRFFARPITKLARRAEKTQLDSAEPLGRLGITEIDQLVDSIETLSQNASKESARTEFFSRMSHDMRTPMNAIISFSSPALLDNATLTQKDDYLSKIHSSGEFLLGLINEVLDMTKIESNKADLRYEPTQASTLGDTVVPMIEKLAQKKSIRFVKEMQGNQDEYLMIDRQHLNQILLNLLSNAVKFTPEGGKVSLCVALNDATDSDVLCSVRVEDTGVGMSQDFLDKLYTPFEQENSALEGTGLGLSITKKLVDRMGGTIECTSQKNVGTTFEVVLPMSKCSEKPSETLSAELLSQESLEGKRILVCEDHPLNTQIVEKLLQREGMIVDTTKNGEEGVSRFSASQPLYYDAILMDIRMPLMDGLQATRTIRALNREDARTIPILAMTANAFAEDIEMSRAAGMNAHLSKPIEPQKLYEALRIAFLKRRTGDAPPTKPETK